MLLRLFLGSRANRVAVALLVAVGSVLIVTTTALQASQRSGEQAADQIVGRSGAVAQVAGYAWLGVPREQVDEDQQIVDRLRDQRITVSRMGWLAPGTALDARGDVRATVEEDDWASQPFPGRLQLLDGRWASSVDEVTVSPGLARQYPVGSRLTFAERSFDLLVVGVVRDRFARQQPLLLLGQGTWASVQSDARSEVQALEIFGQRTVYVDSPASSTSIQQAIAPVAGERPNQQVVVFSRAEFESRGRAAFTEMRLLSVLAPLIGGLLAGMVAIRAINQTRMLLWVVGVAHRRTRLPMAMTLMIVAATGIVLAGSIGLLLAPLVILFFDVVANVEPGPVSGLEQTLGQLVLGCALGTMAAVLLFRNRAYPAAPGRVSKRRGKTLAAPLAALGAGALTLVGVSSTQGSRDPNLLLFGATCLGGAFIVLSPYAVRAMIPHRTRWLMLTVVLRRLRADRAVGLVHVASGLLLLSALSSIIFVYSAVAATNASNRSTVLPGQVQLLELPADSQEAATVVPRLTRSLGTDEPVEVFDATGSVADLDGPLLAVQTVADAERFFAVDLSAAEVSAFEKGAVLRPSADGVSERLVYSGDTTVALPVYHAATMPDSARAWGGVVLLPVLAEYSSTPTRTVLVWTGVPESTLASVSELFPELGLRRSSVGVYRPADQAGLPESAVVLAAGAILANGLIVAATTAADARRLRPTLSGLFAMGAGRRWLRGVVLLRASIASALVVVVALLGALVGAAGAIASSSLSFAIEVPIALVAMTVLGVIAAAAGAGVLATRRLSRFEWQP